MAKRRRMKRGTCEVKQITPSRVMVKARPHKDESKEAFVARIMEQFHRMSGPDKK